jgi:pilus assembly protein CpaF
VQHIDGRSNIRVLESVPELRLRERFPERNIYSVAETQWQSAEALQDALKKSDAAVTIVGEVASNEVASRMIQMAQVASQFTIFSHHALTAKALVFAIRNSLVESGGFNNMITAEQQVVDVLRIDVHIDFDVSGFRYIERITEIIKVEEGIPYPEFDPRNPDRSKAEIEREYYRRQTDRTSFTTRDIIRFNKQKRRYEAAEWLSPELSEHIYKNLPKEYAGRFFEYVKSNWTKGERA